MATAQMSMLVAACPRCGQKKMTFDVLSYVALLIPDPTKKTIGLLGVLRTEYETFCKCRDCKKSVTFLLGPKFVNPPIEQNSIGQVINDSFNILGVVRPHAATVHCPEHVPPEIKAIFDEGAECLAVGCTNAAGAMFRKVVDIVSKGKLPEEDVPAGPDRLTRRNLKPRLKWLFANNLLPSEIEPLAECIRKDASDAVHEHQIGPDEANDLGDLTVALLERVFTMPGRLKAAADRREARHAAGKT